ncbi:MAG TPA: sugar ABC transporter permease [Kofleriaceae bacterium]|nr:sugar ABC transporter permease [Kofleriaceae bacterium]
MSTASNQMRDWGLAALFASIVAIAVFVGHRNHELRARQLELASAGAEAIAEGREPPTGVEAAGLVGAARPSPHYAFLRKRTVITEGKVRELGGAHAPATDKLLYDAAQRFDRNGAFVELLGDNSGRAVAARAAKNGIAVSVVAPSNPAGMPWLILLGALGLGAVIAAAGALVGGAARPLGLALGGALLAIPAYGWGGAGATISIVAGALAITFAQMRGTIDRCAAGLRRHKTALAFLAPATIAMLVLVATPFCVGLVLGFFDHHQGQWTFVGLHNFGEILSGGGRAFDDPLNFWFILGVTVLWTAANVILHVTLGVALALVLKQSWLRGKGVYRMLLILPWAIPNYITALIWKGMFQGEYGAINALLHSAGLDGVSWFSSWSTAFTANVVTNTWLGFPFMMVVALGALESIPRDFYEAAEVDGATGWQRFWHITLPHLRPALAPAVVLGSIWTFNMFNVIFLVSGGKPGGSTDILVTDAYRWAFERGERYGMAAAYGTIIFLVLLLWTVFGARIGRKEEAA